MLDGADQQRSVNRADAAQTAADAAGVLDRAAGRAADLVQGAASPPPRMPQRRPGVYA